MLTPLNLFLHELIVDLVHPAATGESSEGKGIIYETTTCVQPNSVKNFLNANFPQP